MELETLAKTLDADAKTTSNGHFTALVPMV